MYLTDREPGAISLPLIAREIDEGERWEMIFLSPLTDRLLSVSCQFSSSLRHGNKFRDITEGGNHI